MGILIGADFVPTNSNSRYFENGDAESLVGAELLEMMLQADYRIFNLEVPLTNSAQPIKKCGPNLLAGTDTVNGYRALRVDLLTLANNHILDQGINGAISTQKTLDNAGINHVGLRGKNVSDNGSFIFPFNGKKVGVYACAEHEFSTLDSYEIYANPFLEKQACESIRDLKTKCDYIIVLYHGGKEYYQYPSPKLQNNCHMLINSGADLVVCQHSHCIGCEEKYEKGTIVYGQGNYLFDLSNNEYCQTGLLIEINSDFEVSYIPLAKKGHSVSLAMGSEGEEIIKNFNLRSMQIQEAGFVVENYNKFAQKMLETYFWTLSGKESLLFRLLNKLSHGKLRSWSLSRKYSNEAIMKIYNCLICEAHNELLIKGLENRIYE